MQFRDLKRFLLGLNLDDSPADLIPGEYTDAINIRTSSSNEQHGMGVAETLQGEVMVDIIGEAIYYGDAIGGSFVYSGFEEVKIGNQVWMKRNWDVNYPASKVYDDLEVNRTVYGGLYTHEQIMSADFCPAGWHVPTMADMNVLLAYIGGDAIAGGKMKEPGIVHWIDPNIGASDSAGFKGLPGGKYDTAFSLLAEQGLFWLADESEPLPVIALSATKITSSGFNANWELSVGADKYYLDVAEDIGFTSMVVTNVDVGNVLTYRVNGLDAETDYFYRVRACNDIGTSEDSGIIALETSIAAPVAIAATNILQLSFTANWNAVAGATKYYLDLSTVNDFASFVIGYNNLDVGAVTSKDITGLIKSTDYYYRVRAYKNKSGDNSNVISLTTILFTDWFLPSKDELNAMYVNLHLHGVGGFSTNRYWSSSEQSALEAWWKSFQVGESLYSLKSEISTTYSVRACRAFTSTTVYALRDIGPQGVGYFIKTGIIILRPHRQIRRQQDIYGVI